MATWTTYASPARRPVTRRTLNGRNTGMSSSSIVYDSVNTLSAVYKGREDRIQRYTIYDQMDQDSDVSRALDLIAEHVSPFDNRTDLPFQIKYNATDVTDEVTTVTKANLANWSKINNFENRLFNNVRAVLKYGDWFYWRNPETFELFNIHPRFVVGAYVDERNLEILAWLVRGVKFNIENNEMVGTYGRGGVFDTMRTSAQTNTAHDTQVIPAINMIQLTLNEGKYAGLGGDDEAQQGIASRWPFGESVLESMYKTYRQREMMEDASLIHRIQRAPTRRVWYIDVGKNRNDRAKWIINDFRNEINGRLVPKQYGMEGRATDTIYNPQSTLEDYYIPVTAEGKNARVENLEGQPWSDIPELDYMTKKMLRAVRVPYSMMVGPEEGGGIFNDAKVGTAYMQEIEFSKFCSRMQKVIREKFDHEFKMYNKWTDLPVSAADYELRFVPPTNYEDYLQNMRDQDNITIWSQIKDEAWIAKRMAAKHYLKWTDDMMLENERLFVEENFPLNNPLQGDAGTLGGPPMGGAMGGLPPPPPGMDDGMSDMGDPTATGMDGVAVAGAVPGSTGGPAAPAMAGMGESREMQKMVLSEEDLALGDIEPAEKKQLPSTGIYKAQTRNDHGVMPTDPIKGGPLVTLAMIRHLRQMHMSRRIENQKRLRVVQKVYAQQGDAAAAMGGPPPV